MGRPKGSFKVGRPPLAPADVPKPVAMKYSVAAKIADKNSKTIVKISQLLEIIHKPGYAAADPDGLIPRRIEILRRRLNRRLVKLARWVDIPAEERQSEFRIVHRAPSGIQPYRPAVPLPNQSRPVMASSSSSASSLQYGPRGVPQMPGQVPVRGPPPAGLTRQQVPSIQHQQQMLALQKQQLQQQQQLQQFQQQQQQFQQQRLQMMPQQRPMGMGGMGSFHPPGPGQMSGQGQPQLQGQGPPQLQGQQQQGQQLQGQQLQGQQQLQYQQRLLQQQGFPPNMNYFPRPHPQMMQPFNAPPMQAAGPSSLPPQQQPVPPRPPPNSSHSNAATAEEENDEEDDEDDDESDEEDDESG